MTQLEVRRQTEDAARKRRAAAAGARRRAHGHLRLGHGERADHLVARPRGALGHGAGHVRRHLRVVCRARASRRPPRRQRRSRALPAPTREAVRARVPRGLARRQRATGCSAAASSTSTARRAGTDARHRAGHHRARKPAEAAARENEERFREAQRDAGIGSWRYLPDGTLVWSDQMYELLPVPRGVPLDYERVVDVMHPDDLGTRRASPSSRARCSRAPREYQADYRVIWPDGRVRVMHSRGTIHRDAAGRLIEAIGTVQDVTERRQAEARIRQLNRVYAMLGGISEALVREKDPDTVLTAACRITVETGGFRMAWIGLNDDGGQLRDPRARRRRRRPALAIIESLIRDAPPAGCRFTADALARGRHSICDNIASIPDALRWRDEALRRQYRSMASLPLVEQRPADRRLQHLRRRSRRLRRAGSAAARRRRHRHLVRARGPAARRASASRPRNASGSSSRTSARCSGSPNASGALEFVSPAYETMWGRPRAASHRRSPRAGSKRCIPTIGRAWRRTCARSSSPVATDETYRIVRPDGTVRWIRSRSFPVHDQAGQLERVVGTAARRHRAAPARGAVPPGPEDGEHRAPGRRHRPRLQQPAHGHQRHRGTGRARSAARLARCAPTCCRSGRPASAPRRSRASSSPSAGSRSSSPRSSTSTPSCAACRACCAG